MSTFENYRLIIPRLWEKDWSKAIAEADRADRQLLVCQARAGNLLKEITDLTATPERLAWLSLWVKGFALLDGARAALVRQSEYTLRVLERIAFETDLHVHAIIEPVVVLQKLEKGPGGRTTVSDGAKQDAWRSVIDRMRAYTTWCLWGDRDFYEYLLRRKTQDGIWDPSPARAIAGDPEERAAFEVLFGPLPVHNKHELERDQAKQQKDAKFALRRIGDWLDDPRMAPWAARLRQLPEPERRSASFFSILNESETSISARLGQMEMRFAYVEYLRASLLAHGRTLDEMFIMGSDAISPAFVGREEASEQLALSLGNSCSRVCLFLYLLQKHLWPAPGTPS